MTIKRFSRHLYIGTYPTPTLLPSTTRMVRNILLVDMAWVGSAIRIADTM